MRLWADGDHLRYHAPKGILTPTLRVELAKRKADLLAFLQQAHLDVFSSLPPIGPVARDGDVPLSFAQQRLWFLDHLEPGCAAYNLPIALRLQGFLDVAALEQSLREIVHRHEILRTTFPAIDGHPVQSIAPEIAVPLQVVDLHPLPAATRAAAVQAHTTQAAQQPFDLAQGPLWRVLVLRLTAEEHVFCLVFHHIVFDGWSFGIFFQELAVLYAALATGQPPVLPELPIQYADFACWQRQQMQEERLESLLAYWQGQLRGAPLTVDLLTDRPRPPRQTFRGARQALVLPLALTTALKRLSQQEGVTLFMTLLAALQVLLFRYSGQEDIVVGSPIAGRDRTELEGLIGFFVNTLVLRTDLSGVPRFREVLRRVREVCLGAYTHQELPFETLVDALHPQRDLSRNPLFQVLFVLHNTPGESPTLMGLTAQALEVDHRTAQFDVVLTLSETPEGLGGRIVYNTDLFDPATMARMAGHFQTLLEGIIAHPEQKLSALPLLTAAERHQLLVEWNDTRRDYPQDQCIHQLFEAQVAQTPEAVAVVCGDAQMTYRELNRQANQLAHHLRQQEIGPETFVGICMERSLEMIVALLGILKAGGAYVPLDPTYPSERLAFMLADIQASVLLTQHKLVAKLPIHRAHLMCLDTDREHIIQQRQDDPVSGVTPENLAYVMYTSGSTGCPKGVLIPHRALSNYMHWMQTTFPLSEADYVIQKTPISFDYSVWELFAPLLVGGRLIVAYPGRQQDSAYLIELLGMHQVTMLKLVPSLLQMLLEKEALGTCRGLRHVFCGGEPLPSALQEQFFSHLEAHLHNFYGPTEATIDVTYWTCERGSPQRVVPIGRPITNTQVYVLDPHLQPVPIGVPGELFIGGAGLARGYYNRPELTAEKFLPHPFSDEPGARLYRTGDLARYLPDGNLEFLGRRDHQVKIRGFRIELGEIETALSRHPAVRETTVLAQEGMHGDKRLVAYVVPDQKRAPTISELRDFVREIVPEYMVPSTFVLLEAFPLTPNGKVDHRALPPPNWSSPELENAFVAPRTPWEALLVEVWQSVLDLERIGVYDNFFDLGGHSLASMRVIAKVEKQTGLRLHPSDLIYQTLGQLAAVCEKHMPLFQPSKSMNFLQKIWHIFRGKMSVHVLTL